MLRAVAFLCSAAKDCVIHSAGYLSTYFICQMLDTEVLCVWNRRFTRHISWSLFINSFSFKHGSVHFHSNFMQMRSIFSMVAVSDFGKGLPVDERCQATLFAVYLFCSIRLYLEDHHQLPLWKRNIASFIFVSALCSFQTFAIESSMDLIFNTIVNCICFVRLLWSHCHLLREKRIKLSSKIHLGFVKCDWKTLCYT